MLANSSSARKARRSNGAGHVEKQGYECPAQAAREECAAPFRQRPSAAFRVPLVEAHLCAGHRRSEGRDAGVGVLDGKGNAREDRREYRCREGRRQAAGGARGEERRQGSGVRPRRLSLSRPRQGARGCRARERTELLNETRQTPGRGPQRDWKTPWQVNANAADATGTGTARSATASSRTSWSTSIAWRRSSRAASASVLRRWS